MWPWVSKKTVVKVDLGPHDILVLSTDERLSDETCVRLRDHLRSTIDGPGQKIIVLSSGLKLDILHRAMNDTLLP